MNLIQVIQKIEEIAKAQPSVGMIVQNDIFRLNAIPDAKYGVFAWTQGQHSSSVASNLISYQFTFYYVDRLNEDKSNQIEVQSVGIQTLDNIIRTLDEADIYINATYSFRTFNQRFMDECAGAFVTVTMEVPVDFTCADLL